MPFAKGRSGNPHGRPKAGHLFADALRMSLAAKGPNGVKKLRMIADALVEKAIGGDIAAIREIGDRLDGKSRPRESEPPNQGGISVIYCSEADARCV